MADVDLSKAIEVVKDRVFYVVLRTPPHTHAPRPDVHLFTVDDELHYWAFFLDFGPLSSGCLYRFCMMLNSKLTDKALSGKRIYVYSGPHMHKRANTVYLLAAYTLLYLGRTPEEAWRPFQHISPPLAPWHDASPTVDTFHLTILDVLRGIAKARECHFFSHDAFDIEEYEHYEKVENGDMNWIVEGRFLAFAGPHDLRSCSPEGYHTTAVEDLLPYFKAKGIQAVVRLNKKYYNERRFMNVGIDHHDMYYLDGSNPPETILQRFLATVESTPGAIAVHCKAGLGRTGTCIGLYIMKHYRFTAREIIGWMRVCRPGSVIGPQQHFMEELQPRMWAEGEAFRRIKELPLPVPGTLLHRYHTSGADKRALPSSGSKVSTGSRLAVAPVEYHASPPVSPMTTPTGSKSIPGAGAASSPAGGDRSVVATSSTTRRSLGVSTLTGWMGFGRTGSGRNLTSSSTGASTHASAADEMGPTGRETPTTPLSTDSASASMPKGVAATGTTPTAAASRFRAFSTGPSAAAVSPAASSPTRARGGDIDMSALSGAAAMPSALPKYRSPPESPVTIAVPRSGSMSGTPTAFGPGGAPPGSQGDMLRSAKSRSPQVGSNSGTPTGVLRQVGSGVVSPLLSSSAARSPGFHSTTAAAADPRAAPSSSRFTLRAR